MKIMLTCMTGVSSANFAKRLEEAAQNLNMDYKVESTSVADLKNNLAGVDAILVGPQIKFKLNEIKDVVRGRCPIVEIDTLDFNVLKCNKILEEVKKALR